MIAFATLDLLADPWGVAMVVAIVGAALAFGWWLVARLVGRPARGSGRLLSLSLFSYLAFAVGSLITGGSTTTPPGTEPLTIIGADDPTDRAGPDGTRGMSPGTADAAAPAPGLAVPGAATTDPPLHGKAALRFVDEVSRDSARCRDTESVSLAARLLTRVLIEVPRTRAERAAARLETCRRKLVWIRAAAIRRHRVGDREAWAAAAPKRFKTDGLSVQVFLRGAGRDRVRLGSGALDDLRAKALLDGGLRDELADLGFVEVVLANMQTEMREGLTGPSDMELAERELSALGLGTAIALP